MMESTFDTRAIVLITALLLPIIGFFMAATPYLMRRGEVFAVTVPSAAQQDSYLKKLKRQYSLIVSLTTVLITAIAFVFALMGEGTGVMVVVIVGTLVLCVGGYLLMLAYRARTKSYKRDQGWVAEVQESVAAVGEGAIPQALSLRWNLLYVPIVLVTAALGVIGYPHMPDMIPMHADFAGNVNSWEPKSPSVVGFPLFMQAFLIVCFLFSHWVILRSKKWSEPGAPATSALAYGMFARAQSIFLLASGLALTAVIGIVFMLSALDVLSLGQAGALVMAVTVPILIGAIAVSVVYGQAGSRVFKRMQGSDAILADDDEHWKLGVFYFNADDPSLFLPERFGVGWTVNWARPAVWAIIVGGALLTAGFIVGVTLLV